MRFVLVPAAMATAGLVVLVSIAKPYTGFAMAIVLLLLAIGAWDPIRYRFGVRAFATAVTATCLWYLVEETIELTRIDRGCRRGTRRAIP